MKTLHPHTVEAIDDELQNIPEKYQKDFNSTHEGYAVILEEVRELEQEVFFGEKRCRTDMITHHGPGDHIYSLTSALHKKRMREECTQIAAMCARFIQELT